MNTDFYEFFIKKDGFYGFLNITNGDLSKLQMAELARRIGFYARVNGNHIEVDIPMDAMYNDIVEKKESSENQIEHQTENIAKKEEPQKQKTTKNEKTIQ